jgi:hypothetical protein
LASASLADAVWSLWNADDIDDDWAAVAWLLISSDVRGVGINARSDKVCDPNHL